MKLMMKMCRVRHYNPLSSYSSAHPRLRIFAVVFIDALRHFVVRHSTMQDELTSK